MLHPHRAATLLPGAHGVAFAAIQALYDRMKDQEARIERLEHENGELRRGAR